MNLDELECLIVELRRNDARLLALCTKAEAELREARAMIAKAVPRLTEHLRHARSKNDLDAPHATNDLADLRAYLARKPSGGAA